MSVSLSRNKLVFPCNRHKVGRLRAEVGLVYAKCCMAIQGRDWGGLTWCHFRKMAAYLNLQFYVWQVEHYHCTKQW